LAQNSYSLLITQYSQNYTIFWPQMPPNLLAVFFKNFLGGGGKAPRPPTSSQVTILSTPNFFTAYQMWILPSLQEEISQTQELDFLFWWSIIRREAEPCNKDTYRHTCRYHRCQIGIWLVKFDLFSYYSWGVSKGFI